MEKLQKEFDEIKQNVIDGIQNLNQKIEDADGQRVEKDEKLEKDLADFTSKLTEIEDNQKKEADRADELATQLKTYKEKADKGVQNPLDYFKRILKEDEGFNTYKENMGNYMLKCDSSELNAMLHKATILGSAFTGDVSPVTRTPGTHILPHNNMRVRTLFPAGQASGDTVDVIRATITDATAAVAEGATKPENSASFTAVQTPMEVLASLFVVSRQALGDYAQMASVLQNEGMSNLKDVEDNQILNGSGVSPNWEGVITNAGTTFTGGLSTDTDLDSLVKGWFNLSKIDFSVSAILVTHAKLQDIVLKKVGTGRNDYVFPVFLPNGLNPLSVMGTPVIAHSKMPADTFLIMDGSRAIIWDREQANVRFSEEDSTNFQKNLVTVRIEERGNVGINRTEGFISATFTAAQSTLT